MDQGTATVLAALIAAAAAIAAALIARNSKPSPQQQQFIKQGNSVAAGWIAIALMLAAFAALLYIVIVTLGPGALRRPS
jgi:uncharacterized membrane protein